MEDCNSNPPCPTASPVAEPTVNMEEKVSFLPSPSAAQIVSPHDFPNVSPLPDPPNLTYSKPYQPSPSSNSIEENKTDLSSALLEQQQQQTSQGGTPSARPTHRPTSTTNSNFRHPRPIKREFEPPLPKLKSRKIFSPAEQKDSNSTRRKRKRSDPPGLDCLQKRRKTKGSLWVNKYVRQKHLYEGTQTAWLGTKSLPSSDWTPINISCYNKLCQIGAGVYGSVYRGEAPTGKPVALKFLRIENEGDGLPITAIREIKLLKHMDHPNVIKLLDMVTSKSNLDFNKTGYFLWRIFKSYGYSSNTLTVLSSFYYLSQTDVTIIFFCF
jgi:hypothetical protein